MWNDQQTYQSTVEYVLLEGQFSKEEGIEVSKLESQIYKIHYHYPAYLNLRSVGVYRYLMLF